MNLMIVEDNASVRRMLRRILAPLSAEVSECGDGSEALAHYIAARPDVVLMDLRMPQVDGLAATLEIRKFDPAARIVIVTDYDDEEVRSAAYDAGVSGYVLKQDLTGLAVLVNELASVHPSKNSQSKQL